MKEIEIHSEILQLYDSIAALIDQAKTRVAVTANAELAFLYWKVGKSVHDFVLHGNRAAYGKQIITNLSDQLTANYGNGWGEKNIRHCLRAAETIEEEQILYAVRRQLSWTHIRPLLMKIIH